MRPLIRFICFLLKTGARDSPRQSQNLLLLDAFHTEDTDAISYLPFTLSNHGLVASHALSDASLLGYMKIRKRLVG
jgi:hypothetical protein